MGEREIALSKLESLEGNALAEVFYDGLGFSIKYVSLESPNPNAKSVFISAGVHGDEPAGVIAAASLIERLGPYQPRCNFTILPCVNPVGLYLGTRENPAGLDINRHMTEGSASYEARVLLEYIRGKRFDLAIDLHEDGTYNLEDSSPELIPTEFYLYDSSHDTTGFTVIQALQKRGVPISKKRRIYGDVNLGGILKQHDDPDLTLHRYLAGLSDRVITTETPTLWGLDRRVNVQRNAVYAALDSIIQ